ncbi:hypothetical protein VC279_02800 [Xanthomonas sp. WHRI 10064A]|uniref:hypothetical protein n=1 Tax=unclassified Xanthomonas TaxID=2643310 RepID=UPI002B222302|nr:MULTISPECIES: hypothetical protein [unclassified Xanthomonas]MEA9588707.1 hypothetical protein [Xanthomonas sp. WHRI 10064B]MEA9613692.1 hypothetical protein [Xanthomonas sp. WHRI 10064A]
MTTTRCNAWMTVGEHVGRQRSAAAAHGNATDAEGFGARIEARLWHMQQAAHRAQAANLVGSLDLCRKAKQASQCDSIV